MIIAGATIINVAVPQIIRDLGITSTDAQWVQEEYTLVFAALLLAWGRFAHRYGRRLLFVTEAAVSAAGQRACHRRSVRTRAHREPRPVKASAAP